MQITKFPLGPLAQGMKASELNALGYLRPIGRPVSAEPKAAINLRATRRISPSCLSYLLAIFGLRGGLFARQAQAPQTV
jgi:hypothetical protein